jgi:hypothetical protein
LATDLGLQGKLIEIVFNQPDVMNKTLSEVLPEWKNLSLSFTLVIKTSDTVQNAFEKLLNNAYFNLSTLLRYVDIGVDRFGLERIDNTNCRENPGMVCKSCAEIYRTQSNVDESNLKINSKSALVPQFKQGDEDFEEGASVVEHKTKTTLGGSPSKTSTNTRRSVSGGGVLVENVSSHSVYSAPKKRGKKLKKTVAL